MTAEQALAEASSRPGLDNLASLSATNPFPASLDVRVHLVTQLGAVAASVKDDPAVDPTYPTSYDPDTYSRLRRVALIVGAIGGGLLLLFGLVAYAVIANSMRGIATARRQEVTVIRLLGARGWMLRGPFVVEGLMIGALAGALAAAFVAGAWLLATRFESATYAQLLPGVRRNRRSVHPRRGSGHRTDARCADGDVRFPQSPRVSTETMWTAARRAPGAVALAATLMVLQVSGAGAHEPFPMSHSPSATSGARVTCPAAAPDPTQAAYDQFAFALEVTCPTR